MIEVSLPEFGNKSNSVKDLVLSILFEESPLSLMQLFNHILKRYNISITYQAVRKAVDLLVNKKIISKKDRSYSLNKKWFLELKSFVDRIVLSDQSVNIKQFKTVFAEKNYMTFILGSLFDLDNFWGDMLKYLVSHLGHEERLSMNIGHDAWWILINLGRETDIYSYFAQNKMKTYFVLFRNNPLNKHAKKIYESLGHNVRLIDNGNNNYLRAINTVGDSIIQIDYPKEIMEEVQRYFKTHSQNTIDFTKITKIVHKPCEIKFTIFRNNEFANNFNEKYLNYFK